MPKALDCALRLLARREHSAAELVNKLIIKGHTKEDSHQVLMICQKEGWQSDERYADMLCNRRLSQGYGPLRIKLELQNKQIETEIIESLLTTHQNKWEEYAKNAWQKKFKTQKINLNEWQKQQRFLVYRGFPREILESIRSQFS